MFASNTFVYMYTNVQIQMYWSIPLYDWRSNALKLFEKIIFADGEKSKAVSLCKRERKKKKSVTTYTLV